MLKARFTLIAICICSRALAVVPSAVPAAAAARALSVPAAGVYLGIWANPALASTQEQAIEIREGPAANGINRRFNFHLHYYGWTVLAQELDSAGLFHPNAELLGDISRGRIPVISWTCDGKVPNSDHVVASQCAGKQPELPR